MRRQWISEFAAKAGIYLTSTVMLFACLFFAQSARVYQRAGAAAPSSQGTQSVSLPPASSSWPQVLPAGALPAAAAPDTDSASAPEEVILNRHFNMPDADALAAEVARLAAMGFTVPSDDPQFVGEYHATAYCCEVYPHICGGNGVTASGTAPTPGLTAAADWSVLPSGTWLYISGVGIRRVEDTGSAIKQNRLDVAVDTHENALRWGGFGRHDVWVLAWGKSKK